MARKFGNVKELPSGSFRARYTYRGKTYSKTFARKSQAELWRESEQRLILLDEWTPPAERDRKKELAATTVADFFETLPEKRHWQESTQAGYQSMFKNDIKPVLGDKPLQAVTRDDVRNWYFGMLKVRKGRNKRNRDVYALLATLFNQAVHDELIEVSPVAIEGASKRPPAKKEQEIPTPAEFTRILVEVPSRFKAPTLIAAGCALRIGEWSELRRKDVVRDGSTWKLHICRQVREGKGSGEKYVVPFTKTKQPRWVTVPAGCVPALKQHMEAYSQPGREGLLFPNKDGEWVDRRRFNRMLKRRAVTHWGIRICIRISCVTTVVRSSPARVVLWLRQWRGSGTPPHRRHCAISMRHRRVMLRLQTELPCR